MRPLRKTYLERVATREKISTLLRAVVSGEIDAYMGYKQLYGFWCAHNSATQELRPLFRISGIEANGTFSVTPEFRNHVVNLAKEILPKFQDSASKNSMTATSG
jgi:hypothetical protein